MLKKKKWYLLFHVDGYRFFTYNSKPTEFQYVVKVDKDGVVKRISKYRGGMFPKSVSLNIAKGLTFPPVKNTLREVYYVE